MPKVKIRLPLLLAAAFFAACDGSDSTGPEVTTITVTPATAAVDFLGSTVQFSAQVEDQDGKVMSGVAITWTSSNPAVAAVDPSGRATALAAGTAQISASANGITGRADISVTPAPCTTELNLAPGDFQILPVDCAITLPAGSFGDRYRVGVLNQNVTGSAANVSSVTLNVSEVAAPAPPAASGLWTPPVQRQESGGVRDRMALTARDYKHLRWAEGLQRRTRAVHAGLRAAEVALVEALGPGAVLPDLSAQAAASPQAVDLPAKLQLRPNSGSSCTNPVALQTAVLLGQNDHLAVYQDSALNAAASTQVTPAQAQRILNYYAAYGKATIDAYYPGVPDVDGNGKIILYVSFDDALDDGATAAYVWGGDLLPNTGDNSCAASNARELTYFNAALIRELDNGFTQAFETTVHEVKHISSFWHGIARTNRLQASAFQPSWLEEGSAEIAGNMSARRAWAAIGGPAPNDRLVGQDFRDARDNNGGSLPEEAFGVVLRLFRAQGYLSSQPNGLVVTPNGADSDHSVYGSGWTFLRFLGDAYGNAGLLPYRDADFFAAQNDSLTAPGILGLEQITGKSFQALLEEFAVAAMFHMQPGEPLTGRYTSYDFVDAIEIFCFAADDPCESTPAGPAGSFPWPVTATLNGPLYAPFAAATFTGSTGPTGLRVHEFRSNGTGNGIALKATANQPAKVIVARVE